MYAIRSYYEDDVDTAKVIGQQFLDGLSLTELLDQLHAVAEPAPVSWMPQTAGWIVLAIVLVITSYSIHYTKLYDVAEFAAQKVAALAPGGEELHRLAHHRQLARLLADAADDGGVERAAQATVA